MELTWVHDESPLFMLSPPPLSFPSPVRRQNMKVRINATGDTIVMKFVRPNPDVKLEGYILGYGSSMFSKQFIQLPENGQPYETEMGTDTDRTSDQGETDALAPPRTSFVVGTRRDPGEFQRGKSRT